MEYAPASISIASKLFEYGFKIYKLYKDTREAGTKYVRQRILLDIQAQRYENWGNFVGLDKGEYHPTTEQTQAQLDLMVDILAQISDILVSASELKAKYEEGANSGATLVEDEQITIAQITQRQLKQHKFANWIKSQFGKGLKFALWDGEKFEEFHLTLIHFIEGLESLTGVYHKRFEALLYTQLLRNKSREELRELGQANIPIGRVIPELADRKSAYMELSERQKSAQGARLFGLTEDKFKLSASDIKPERVSKKTATMFGTYQNDKPVAVEWKLVSEELTPDEALKRLSNVAEFLSTSIVGVETHLPRSIGYYRNPGITDRIALVYEDPGPHSSTLFDAIADAKFQHISLGERYKLALALAESLFYLRLTGWFHRAIRSSNILICGDPPTPDIRLLLVGFTSARLEKPWEKSDKIISGQYDELYHHPTYQGKNKRSVNYSYAFDIYSLGVCLIEIATWQPISELGEYDVDHHSPVKFKRKLCSNDSMGFLEFTVGKEYRRAVQWCLGAVELKDKQDGSGEEKDSAMEFWDQVVLKLANCRSSVD
ncbi:uncharacterized protein BDR25DRAFT_376499 [Lindgomyces ingoldianus]|uniref:Uncharacterized protein n=1 Tax=Lindgomyces ingoldianus TaxID=673940 RepID=A0ACB6QJ18_9PLEO|nr:uncharacterized protein BDR25DRAFT_376499 [Lindgomyces ingoldianus]KAF2466944.1 hypothetical protein BDR25DRAFT_376499 [Lindgomyces ingoldianus]